MFDTSDEAIGRRLQELEELETVSAFSREFIGLIAQFVARLPVEQAVRLALAGLLDVELRYHRDLRDLAANEQFAPTQIGAAGERHRVGLQTVAEFAADLPGEEALPAAARSLVLAECHYHLRRTAAVVEALEEVLALGVDQPLVHFALGYNRYVLALELCTHAAEAEGEAVVHDALGLQLRCLRAVAALEDGLRGEELDLQLYWWMGVILEAAGLTEAARDAYDKSAALLAEVAPEPAAAGDEEPGAGPTEAATAQAITDDELRIVGEMLKGRFDPADLLEDGSEDSS